MSGAEAPVAGMRRTEHRGARAGYLIGAGVDAVLLYLINVRPGWDAVPFLTSRTAEVIGWVNASIVAGLVANLLYVGDDRGRFRAFGGAVTTAIGIVPVVRLMQVFPFDLSQPWTTVAWVLLWIALIGSVIGVLSNVVTLLRPGAGRDG